MNKPYTVFGTKKQGYRICVPTKAKTADEYTITHIKFRERVLLPAGALVYVPKVEP